MQDGVVLNYTDGNCTLQCRNFADIREEERRFTDSVE